MNVVELLAIFVGAPVMGALGWFATHMANRMYLARVFKRKAWQRWIFQAEEKGTRLVHAQTEVALLKQELSDLIVECPEPYEGSVLELSRFGYQFEKAALAVATAKGCYHLGEQKPERAVLQAMVVPTAPQFQSWAVHQRHRRLCLKRAGWCGARWWGRL